jgi:hypothetical protein
MNRKYLTVRKRVKIKFYQFYNGYPVHFFKDTSGLN